MPEAATLSSSEAVRDREPVEAPEPAREPEAKPEAPRSAFGDVAERLRASQEQYLGARGRISAGEREYASELAPAIQAARQSIEARASLPAPPIIKTTGPPPSRQLTNFLTPREGEKLETTVSKMMQGIGQMVMGLGLGGRGNAKAALASWAGALKGWQEGDREQADRHFDDWKASSDKAFKDWEVQRKSYEDILKAADLALEDKFRLLNLLKLEREIKSAPDVNDAETFKQLVTWHEQELRSAAEAQRAADQLAESKRTHDELERHHREDERLRERALTIKQTGTSLEGSGYDDVTLDRLAEQYASGEDINRLVKGRSGAATKAIIEIQKRGEALLEARGESGAALVLRRRNLVANTGALAKLTKDESDFNSFLITFEGELKQTEKLFEAAKTSGSPIWNKPALWYRSMVNGDPTAKNLMSQMELIANSMARITLRSRGTAEGTRQHHRELMDGSMTLEQFMSLAQEVMTFDAQQARRGFAEQRRILQERISGSLTPTPEGGAAAGAADYNFNPATGRLEPVKK